MDFEAGATGKDIALVQGAPLTKRLVMAPVGLIAAEVGAQAGVFVEDLLAGFFTDKKKKGKRDKSDKSWRVKVLVGKTLLSVLLYPVSAPLALGFAASGGLLHLLLGFSTFAECEDQAHKRQRQLAKLGVKPQGRYTQKLKDKDDAKDEESDEESDDESDTDEGDAKDKKAGKDRAEAEESDIDLAAKLTDPDVLNVYGKAADLAWERLIQQGHLPPGTKPVINEAMVQEVQGLVRDAQKRGAL
jgi:hypothetical protein